MYHIVCLFTPQLSLVFVAHTHRGTARQNKPGCLVLHRDGLHAAIRLPIQVLTGPGIVHLR